MTRRAFVVQLALTIALVVILNVAIARLAVNSVPRRLLRAIALLPADTNNSQVSALTVSETR